MRPREPLYATYRCLTSLGACLCFTKEDCSTSGVGMITGYKITQCHVVPMLRPSCSGTNPPLMAMLLLHLRRLGQPPEEATAEDKIPHQSF